MNSRSVLSIGHDSNDLEMNDRDISGSIARLRWLMGLRWLALISVSASASLAVIGLVPGLNLMVITLAVLIGVGSNVYIQWGLTHPERIPIERLHVGQALFDTLVLSLVLWSAGGADCPFTTFYVFPVLLSVLLSARGAFWPTALASFAGLLWQEISCVIPILRVGIWNPVAPWADVFRITASILTIAMVAYFAARFIEAMREQMRAKRDSDELLRFSFERLQAGVEIIEEGTTVWQNPFALKALGERRFQAWTCPGSGRGEGCPQAAEGCGLNEGEGALRCRFSLDSELKDQRRNQPIYEVMLLSPPDMSQRVAIYIDQTSEVIYQRKLMNTERLASLGRTAQGVAHELNTPLATIQTLGRDVLDVLASPWSREAAEDMRESTQIILEEVMRCSRITHALLGRSDANTRIANDERVLSIEHALNRAVALVFPHETEKVKAQLGLCAGTLYPFDPLVQIFVNLIQNAHDAMSDLEKFDSLDPYIEVTCSQENRDTIELHVIDRGGGIEGESAILFEPFYTTKSIGQGTGLGLYTSYALAKELGGELSLNNNERGGATATLSLPRVASSIPNPDISDKPTL